MELTITGRHFEVTPHLREYVEKKIKKITRYDHQILEGEIILFQDRAFDVAEGKIHSGHFLVTAIGHGKDMYEAVNDLTDKIIVQLEKHREKAQARRRHAHPEKPGQ
jgi:putative sigma-54 modulation protein|uniref:Ribosome-associated translation inhibitor RaiA n=1 Tax=candidate division WOR-3 bacterium TaxID=2052148 RepID=A0A7V3PTR7_UNCW3